MIKKSFYFCLVLIFQLSVLGQVSKQPENPALNPKKSDFQSDVVTLQLKSGLMKREMPYRVILPFRYKSEKEKRYPVIYLLHGLTGHFNDWTDRTKISEYATDYRFIIVMPEGGDGWYTDSTNVSNDKYESYIITELIPEIDRKFRTIANRENQAIGGLSMGGFGAIKFGLKYPEKFALVGSFSGALGAAGWTEKEFGARGFLANSILSVFGKPESTVRIENDIFKIVREISADKIKNQPFIYLDCGTEDFLIKSNRDFAALLFEKKIPHEYRQLPGGHTWVYWDKQVREFLELTEQHLKK
ncbi:MAG TPA: alpha/beta hydrolase family protein [Pyrinomonadaceae bacterium]|nr:alpha/beta hydrolase family protein [Pyrinomonadaceae bacterium]